MKIKLKLFILLFIIFISNRIYGDIYKIHFELEKENILPYEILQSKIIIDTILVDINNLFLVIDENEFLLKNYILNIDINNQNIIINLNFKKLENKLLKYKHTIFIIDKINQIKSNINIINVKELNNDDENILELFDKDKNIFLFKEIDLLRIKKNNIQELYKLSLEKYKNSNYIYNIGYLYGMYNLRKIYRKRIFSKEDYMKNMLNLKELFYYFKLALKSEEFKKKALFKLGEIQGKYSLYGFNLSFKEKKTYLNLSKKNFNLYLKKYFDDKLIEKIKKMLKKIEKELKKIND